MRLTQENIAAIDRKFISDKATDRIEWDEQIAGFGYRMQGRKRTWVIQYRINYKQRRLTLGSAAVLSAKDARKIAQCTLADVIKGIDPQQMKQEARAAAKVTLRSVIGNYLEARKPELRPNSYLEIERYLQDYWRPLHNVPIDGIDRARVATRLRQIITTNGPIVAASARIALSSMFGWALREGLCQQNENPVTFTNDPGKGAKARERVLTDAELAAVWNACADDAEYFQDRAAADPHWPKAAGGGRH